MATLFMKSRVSEPHLHQRGRVGPRKGRVVVCGVLGGLCVEDAHLTEGCFLCMLA